MLRLKLWLHRIAVAQARRSLGMCRPKARLLSSPFPKASAHASFARLNSVTECCYMGRTLSADGRQFLRSASSSSDMVAKTAIALHGLHFTLPVAIGLLLALRRAEGRIVSALRREWFVALGARPCGGCAEAPPGGPGSHGSACYSVARIGPTRSIGPPAPGSARARGDVSAMRQCGGQARPCNQPNRSGKPAR